MSTSTEQSTRAAVVAGADCGNGKAVTRFMLGDGYRAALAEHRLGPLRDSAEDHSRALCGI